MNVASESFDIRQSSRGRISTAREHDQVGLADSLARPCRGFATAKVNHQRRGVFEFVEPVSDFGCIQSAPRKHCVEAGGIDDLDIGRGEPITHSTIKGAWKRLPPALD